MLADTLKVVNYNRLNSTTVARQSRNTRVRGSTNTTEATGSNVELGREGEDGEVMNFYNNLSMYEEKFRFG